MASEAPDRSQKRTERPADFAVRVFGGETYTKLAAEYGVQRRTVARWAEDPEVVAEVASMAAEVKAAVINRRTKLALLALDVQEELLLDTEVPAAVRAAIADKVTCAVAPVAAMSEVKVTGALDLGRTDDADLEARARALAAAVLGEVEKPPLVEDGGDG